MSADFEAVFTQPSSLGWKSENEGDLRQRYRELDAPLTRYVLGIGRSIAGLPPLPNDWNWSVNWEQIRRRRLHQTAACYWSGGLPWQHCCRAACGSFTGQARHWEDKSPELQH